MRHHTINRNFILPPLFTSTENMLKLGGISKMLNLHGNDVSL